MDVTFFGDMSYFFSSNTILQVKNLYSEELYYIDEEELEGSKKVTHIEDISMSPVEILNPLNQIVK